MNTQNDLDAAVRDWICGHTDGEKILAKDAFKAGANWQKEQMMKGFCFETKVYQDCDGDDIESPFQTWLSLEQNEITALPNLGLSDGDKVKIIIVKENK